MTLTEQVTELREQIKTLTKRVQRLEIRTKRAILPDTEAITDQLAARAGKLGIPVLRPERPTKQTVREITSLVARMPRMQGGVPGYPSWYRVVGGDFVDSPQEAVTIWFPITTREDMMTVTCDPDWPPFVQIEWSWSEAKP